MAEQPPGPLGLSTPNKEMSGGCIQIHPRYLGVVRPNERRLPLLDYHGQIWFFFDTEADREVSIRRWIVLASRQKKDPSEHLD